MVKLCKKYGFIYKEHNGDWVSIELMLEKFELGLDCINVAPELGQIETKAILKYTKSELSLGSILARFRAVSFRLLLNLWLSHVMSDVGM